MKTIIALLTLAGLLVIFVSLLGCIWDNDNIFYFKLFLTGILFFLPGLIIVSGMDEEAIKTKK